MDFKNLRMSGLVFFVLFVQSAPLQAAESQYQRSTGVLRKNAEKQITPKRVKSADQIQLLFGVQQGVAAVASDTLQSYGSFTQLSAIGSYILPSFIFDLGVGWMTSNLTGESTTGGSTSGMGLQSFEMTTQAMILSLSPQWRWTESLQIGPVAQILMGEDVGFRPGIGYSGQTTAWLGGLQALYAFQIDTIRLKLGAQYLKSFDLENKNLESIQGSLQVGFPVL